MPVLTTPPLLGAAGRLVSGRVKVTPTEWFPAVSGSGLVLTAPQSGIIRDGLFYDSTGAAALWIEPTPEGVGMRIDLYLMDQDAARGTTVLSRTVVVPDVEQVDWTYLSDFDPTPPPPPDPDAPGQGFGLTPFGTGPFGM